jgi:uncharacterized protein (DUF58 family)
LSAAAAPHAIVAPAQKLASGLPKLLLAAERLAFVAAPGLHGRRRAGPGESFWQFRDWRDGDDARRIDWRRSAMGERLYLREREWEAQAGIRLNLHDTAGLDFSGDKNRPSKRERAMLILLALAALLLRAGERVALEGRTPMLSGDSALERLAVALIAGGSARTDGNARSVAFGDFLRPDPAFSAPPGGAVLQILDPAECDFPYAGRIVFEGFAAEAKVEAAQAESWAATYRNRIAAQREAVANAARAAGQTPLFHRTDAPPATALAALYQALRQA